MEDALKIQEPQQIVLVQAMLAGVQLEQRQSRISIHAPREGSDLYLSNTPTTLEYISIHAPREGSDCRISWLLERTSYFYPRSP